MMIRLFLIISLLLGIVHAESKRYFIQLGSFQQFHNLEQTIQRMPTHLRSHIIIVNSNGWFVPLAYNTPNYNILLPKLPEYKRYFRDAYINDSPFMLQQPIVRSYVPRVVPITKSYGAKSPSVYNVPSQRTTPSRRQNVAISEEDYTVPYTPPTPKTQKIASVQKSAPKAPKKAAKEVEEEATFEEDIPGLTIPQSRTRFQKATKGKKEPNYFTKEMLSGKQFYLAYKATKTSPNLLVKVSFGNYRVTYQPIIGEMRLADANYYIDEKKLYMYARDFNRNGAYSKLEARRKDHLLVSSWSEGKKLNTLRYYYKLNDAKAYLGEESSQDQLSNTLQSGRDTDWGIEEE